MNKISWLGMGTAALTMACSGSGADSSDAADTDSAIVGGTNDDKHSAVALIRFTGVAEDGTTVPLNCTGSLVAKDLVLTAAHCVKPLSGKLVDYTVSFEATTNAGNMIHPIKVTKTRPHPQFASSFGEFDVALLTLESTPAGLEPMPIVSKLDDPTGQEITFIGYGATGKSEDGSTFIGGNDRRRIVTTKVSATSEIFIEYKGAKGICGGDSGGPAVMTIDGVETIVGTNDLADVGCDANGSALRIDDRSTSRQFLAEHIPGLSPAVAPVKD